MANTTLNFLSAFGFMLFSVLIGSVLSQESIQAAKGINIWMHAGLALMVCFSILGSCAIGINIITRMCAKRFGNH